MSRIVQAVTLCGAIVLGACSGSSSPSAATVNPQDPAITAAIDSILGVLQDGAAHVDADKVLSPAAQDSSLTLVVGNVILTGFDKIHAGFKATYAGLEKQDQTVIEKRIRVLTPDVAIADVLSEGTYTDKAGWTSDPVDITTTLVFVRENGQWRIRHGHQSITR